MKKLLYTFCLIGALLSANAQQDDDLKKIEKACMDYLEGFYEGDTNKIISSVKPSLYKFGYWKSKKSKRYEEDGHMSYQEAVTYAKRVKLTKSFAKADAIKGVKILDVENHIASAKITAYWGVDYALLSKDGDKWVIEQILWEGPLQKPAN